MAHYWAMPCPRKRLISLSDTPYYHCISRCVRLDEGQLDAIRTWVECWRCRLYDLSWFMRCLNESIARMANKEDNCTGRFWEGRFKSQALLDERAVLACMAYVDLNSIRAGIAMTPEHSEFTSIKERIEDPETNSLRPFSEYGSEAAAFPFPFEDYLQLVDWCGRGIGSNLKGYTSPETPPILQRLGMDQVNLLDYLDHKTDSFTSALGPISRLHRFAHSVGRKFIKGITLGRKLCPECRNTLKN